MVAEPYGRHWSSHPPWRLGTAITDDKTQIKLANLLTILMMVVTIDLALKTPV